MKPIGPAFDREWRSVCQLSRTNRRILEPMIKTHYLGKWPTNIMLTLALKRGQKYLGGIIFSSLHRNLQEVFGQNVWEISRLWVDDIVPQNAETFIIGRSLRYLKQNHSDIKTVISFADPKFGHNGIIYRAANFKEI